MKEKTLYRLRAGAFTCGVFLRYFWGKTILRITIRKAIGGLEYREFTFSNSRELEDLAVLLQAIKKDLNGILRKETCSPSFLFWNKIAVLRTVMGTTPRFARGKEYE
jgi:hypothetical protein